MTKETHGHLIGKKVKIGVKSLYHPGETGTIVRAVFKPPQVWYVVDFEQGKQREFTSEQFALQGKARHLSERAIPTDNSG